jgi:hypothetical protein
LGAKLEDINCNGGGAIMSEIKPFIEKGNGLFNKYKYSNKNITKKKEESEKDFLTRVEKETYLFRLVNNKEDYTTLKDFDENGNKRVLIYIQVL